MTLVLNPLAIKSAIDVKNWIQNNPIRVISKFIDVVKTKDDSGFVAVFEFKFKTEKEAKMFQELYKLAEQFGV